MQNDFFISIIMNCYNGERYLKQSLNSVINQTYKNWELIFWDNKSTDNSAKILKSYKDNRIKYFKAKNFKNLGESRQKAYQKCKGDLIAFLDTDDIWFKKKLEYQIKCFKDPEVGIVISNTFFFNNFNKKKLYTKPPQEGYVAKELIKKYTISLETLIIRKNFLKKLDHVFDKKFSHISDLDLVIRLSDICKLKFVNKILAGWRVHYQSETWKYPEKFIVEKKIFIKKIKKKYKELYYKYNSEWERFIIDTELRNLINLLVKNKIFKCFKENKKIFSNYKFFIIFLISFIPKINIILSMYLKYRSENFLKNSL